MIEIDEVAKHIACQAVVLSDDNDCAENEIINGRTDLETHATC